ncbi:hypothetical protein CS0771_02940 [Catellatospora sp. IY07-71]|nr:hypothetical protein CS0771_02940 [Catellatospora sp. IY07-71]
MGGQAEPVPPAAAGGSVRGRRDGAAGRRGARRACCRSGLTSTPGRRLDRDVDLVRLVSSGQHEPHKIYRTHGGRPGGDVKKGTFFYVKR